MEVPGSSPVVPTLMAANGELPWPSVGNFASAYGDDLMAADTQPASPSARMCVGQTKPADAVLVQEDRPRLAFANGLGESSRLASWICSCA